MKSNRPSHIRGVGRSWRAAGRLIVAFLSIAVVLSLPASTAPPNPPSVPSTAITATPSTVKPATKTPAKPVAKPTASTGARAAADSGATKPKTAATSNKLVIKSPNIMLVNDRLELPSPIIEYKGTTITAVKGVIIGKKESQVGTFTGNVKIVQTGSMLTCNTLEVLFKQDKVIASGSVVIHREEERTTDKGVSSKALTTVRCDKAEFFTTTNDFIAVGNVRLDDVSGKERTQAQAKKMLYTDKDKKVAMTGGARVERSDGTVVKAESITYWTNTEALQVSGSAEITTFVD